MGPFPGSGMAIGGRHRAPKWLQKAIMGPFVAISRSGGSELVDQRGSRLDLVRAHPGRCVGTYSRVRIGHRGRHRARKWLQKAINGPFVAISRSGSSKLVDQHVSRFDQVRKHPGDVLDPFPGSRMVNGGRHRTQKWSKNVINGHFVAISRSGGSEWPFRTRE